MRGVFFCWATNSLGPPTLQQMFPAVFYGKWKHGGRATFTGYGKLSYHSAQISKTTQGNHSFCRCDFITRAHTRMHAHTRVSEWSALFILTIVPSSLLTMTKPSPYSALSQWPLVQKKKKKKNPGRVRNGNADRFNAYNTQTHTHTQQECGLNEQGASARSIHALLVYGRL